MTNKMSYLLEFLIVLMMWFVLVISVGLIPSTVFCGVFWGLFRGFGR